MGSLVFCLFFYLVNNSSYLVNNLSYLVNNWNNLLLIIIVPEKPHWGVSMKYVCTYCFDPHDFSNINSLCTMFHREFSSDNLLLAKSRYNFSNDNSVLPKILSNVYQLAKSVFKTPFAE